MSPIAPAVHRALRVALLVRCPDAPVWIADVANALLVADAFDVSALVVPGGSGAPPVCASLSTRLAKRTADRCRDLGLGPGRSAQSPFTPTNLGKVLPSLPVHILSSGYRATEAAIDVAVAADSYLAKEDYAARGLHFRLGAWYSPELDYPDRRVDLRSTFGTSGLRTPEQVAVTVNAVVGEPPVEREVMTADVSLLAARNRADAAWGAASLVLAALEHACRYDRAAPVVRTTDSSATSRPGQHTRSGSTASRVRRPRLLSYAGRAAVGAAKRTALHGQWLLAYHFGDGLELAPNADTHFVAPPADRFWADPHVVFVDGEYHVFYEEYLYSSGKGHIGTMRLGDAGPLDESRVVLTSQCHLSYPFVFAFEGEWFMIPESAEARRIDVFRAEEFPIHWTFAATLMNDVRALDTTMVEHEGRWWLFTTIRRLSGRPSLSHLYLFSAESPLSEVWEPHPMNPIASGAAGARSAGSIMTHDNRLIRPSQDSCESYGRRIRFSEIALMTRTEFRERPAGGLEPNESVGFVGLHTVSHARDLTIVDLCRWRTRLPWRRPRA